MTRDSLMTQSSRYSPKRRRTMKQRMRRQSIQLVMKLNSKNLLAKRRMARGAMMILRRESPGAGTRRQTSERIPGLETSPVAVAGPEVQGQTKSGVRVEAICGAAARGAAAAGDELEARAAVLAVLGAAAVSRRLLRRTGASGWAHHRLEVAPLQLLVQSLELASCRDQCSNGGRRRDRQLCLPAALYWELILARISRQSLERRSHAWLASARAQLMCPRASISLRVGATGESTASTCTCRLASEVTATCLQSSSR
mmetsp:Transcript_29130/g.53627  ORF Transcript_29130/g.53627 Transcript_29130/m.53627 type:complete len:256 (-) Transcript_29130:78-845(-)